MRLPRPVLILGCAAALAISVAAGLWLFRSERLDNPALGIIWQRYRWGRPYSIELDSNRDGAVDFRTLINPLEDSFHPHASYTEFWEDRNFDGSFEVHAVMGDDTGEMERLEIDRDGDGTYEQRLEGDEARASYRQLTGVAGHD